MSDFQIDKDECTFELVYRHVEKSEKVILHHNVDERMCGIHQENSTGLNP